MEVEALQTYRNVVTLIGVMLQVVWNELPAAQSREAMLQIADSVEEQCRLIINEARGLDEVKLRSLLDSASRQLECWPPIEDGGQESPD